MKNRLGRYLLLATAAALLAGGAALWAQESESQSGRGRSEGGRSDRSDRFGGGNRNDRGGQGDQGDRGGRGGGGFFGGSREEREAQMADMMREKLGAKEEDFKAIAPLLKAVTDKQRALRGVEGNPYSFMMGGRRGGSGRDGGDNGGRGGRGGDEGDRGGRGGDRGPRGGGFSGFREDNAAMTALNTTLDSPNAKPAEIKSKLDALRKERVRIEGELKKAREALREVVTPRQEAQLVVMGILD